MLVLIASRRQLTGLVTERLSNAARVLMERFWPGPLTLIMPAIHLPAAVTAGTGTVGVRQVGRSDLAALLEIVGPVTGTSANRSDASPADTAQQVARIFGHEVDLIVDGGPAFRDFQVRSSIRVLQ